MEALLNKEIVMSENGKKLPSQEEIEEMIAQVNVVLQFMDKQNQKELLQIKANAEKNITRI